MLRVGESGDKLRGSNTESSSAKIGVIQQHTMEIAEILHDIERNTGRFARSAVEAAVSRREEVTPELLRILEEITARTAELPDDDHYMAHLYAMLLLAQFREVRAYPLVVRYASLPGNILDSLGSDFITEHLGNVLASVCGGELEGIQSVIENEDAFEWTRGAALSSLVTLVVTGQKSREEIVSYFASLFRGKLARQGSHVWDSLVSYSCDIYPEELIGDIEQAYEEDLVNPGYIGFDEIKRDLAVGKDRVLARLAESSPHRLVDDTVAEMEWWACFHVEPNPSVARFAQSAPPVQFQRPNPKIGRNDPCPCGSGKKYKKCCGA